MKKTVIAFVLFMQAVVTMAQVDAKQVDSLNVWLASPLLRYNFPHKATSGGIYVTQLMAGTPDRDERGQYSYSIDFVKWTDITSVKVMPNSNRDGQVLVLYGAVKNYMFNKAGDLEFDGRGYKFSRDKESVSIFYFGKSEYEVMDKVREWIRIFTGK